MGNNIIFTSIPYGTKTENLLDELQNLAKEKPELGIKKTRDECGKNSSIKIVVECKNTVQPEVVVKQIFLNTNFATTQSYNMVALVDGEPKQLNLEDAIRIYVDHNIDCLIRETHFDIDKAEKREEVVDGLLIALADIDEVISIIRGSKNSAEAKEKLVAKYKFTENQVSAILAMRLSSLTKLDGIKLRDEKATLQNNLQEWRILIENPFRQVECIKNRLEELVKKYGDARRTELTQETITKEQKEKEEIIPEDVVVVVSQSGLVKRIPKGSFRTQNRGGRGIKTKDKAILTVIKTNTVDTIMFFTDKGKMYKTVVENIEEGTNATIGKPIAGLVDLDLDENVIAAGALHDDTLPEFIIFITKNGMVKKSLLSDYMSGSRNSKKGIKAINLKDNDTIVNVIFQDKEDIFLITKKGMGLFISTDDINAIGRIATGRKGIKLNDGDEVVNGLPVHKKTDNLAVIYTNGKGKRLSLENYTTQGKNTKGNKYSDGSEVAGIAMVDNNDSLLLIGTNTICIKCDSIPISKTRVTSGVILVKNNIDEITKL